ncbi:MAG: hypothetical protein EOP48_29815, partial [Sphingobacteriales bacterium]
MAQDPEKIRLQDLATKYLKGTITDAEQKEFDQWFMNESAGNINVPADTARSENEHRDYILSRIHHDINGPQRSKIFTLLPRIAAAAVILAFLSFGTYFLLH